MPEDFQTPITDRPAQRFWPWLVLLLAIVTALNLSWLLRLPQPLAYGHDPLGRALTNLATWETEGAAALVHYLRAERMLVDFQLTHLWGALLLKPGGDFHALMLAPTFWLIVLLLCLYLTARRLAGPAAGLLAAALAAGWPGVYGWSRIYASITGNMALTALGVCLAAYSNRGRRLIPAALAGAIAALCLKGGETVGEALSNLLTVLPPAVVLIFPSWNKEGRRGWWGLALFLAVFAALLDWPWLFQVTDYLQREVGAPPAGGGGSAGAFAYASAILFYQTAPPLLIGLLLLFGLAMLKRRRPAIRAWLPGLVWIAAPLFVLSFVAKKNVHYLQPALPGLALLAAGLLAPVSTMLFRRWWVPLWLMLLLPNVAAAFFPAEQMRESRLQPYFQLTVPDLRPIRPDNDDYRALVAAATACRPRSILILSPPSAGRDRMLGAPEDTLRFLFNAQRESPPLHDFFLSLGFGDETAVRAMLADADAYVLLDDFAGATTREELTGLLQENIEHVTANRQRHSLSPADREAAGRQAAAWANLLPEAVPAADGGAKFSLWINDPQRTHVPARLVCSAEAQP